jgi:hypothetical protein
MQSSSSKARYSISQCFTIFCTEYAFSKLAKKSVQLASDVVENSDSEDLPSGYKSKIRYIHFLLLAHVDLLLVSQTKENWYIVVESQVIYMSNFYYQVC